MADAASTASSPSEWRQPKKPLRMAHARVDHPTTTAAAAEAHPATAAAKLDAEDDESAFRAWGQKTLRLASKPAVVSTEKVQENVVSNAAPSTMVSDVHARENRRAFTLSAIEAAASSASLHAAGGVKAPAAAPVEPPKALPATKKETVVKAESKPPVQPVEEKDPKVLTRLGEEALAARETRSAVEHFKRALEHDPGNEKLREKLHELCLDIGEFSWAETYKKGNKSASAEPKTSAELLFRMDDALERGATGEDAALQSLETLMLSTAALGKLDALAKRAHPRTGVTALMVASGRGRVDLLRTLLGARAEVNKVDKAGASALIWAARLNQSEAVKLLVSQGKATFPSSLSAEEIASWSPRMQETVMSLM